MERLHIFVTGFTKMTALSLKIFKEDYQYLLPCKCQCFLIVPEQYLQLLI